MKPNKCTSFKLFKEVEFPDAVGIAFVGESEGVDNYPFRVLNGRGVDDGIRCEFAPFDLRYNKFFFCRLAEFNAAVGRDGVASSEELLVMPDGLCKDIRIVAALLRIAYPKGIDVPMADFGAIDDCVSGCLDPAEGRTIPLPTAEDAEKIVSYAPFDEDKYAEKLSSIGWI